MNKKEVSKIAKRSGVPIDHVYNLENTDDWMITHGPDQCAGEFCCIHNLSDHSMRSFPQLFRFDRGIMERTCPHGIGHPDPDQAFFFEKFFGDEANAQWVHGCDGCCRPIKEDT